jgi:hypothetical protein
MEEDEAIAMLLAWRANKKPKIGGSFFGRQKLWRERIEGHNKLMRMYFNDDATFLESYFRRHFRMSTGLFKRIAEEVAAALRMLAYGIPADLIDDHLAMGESTAIKCVNRFVVAIVQVFCTTYLRAPNAEDAVRLLEENAARGFPGMLGSIDCMHWSWKNCPVACMDSSKGRKRIPL